MGQHTVIIVVWFKIHFIEDRSKCASFAATNAFVAELLATQLIVLILTLPEFRLAHEDFTLSFACKLTELVYIFWLLLVVFVR